MLIVLVSRAGLAAPQADVIDAIHCASSRLSRGGWLRYSTLVQAVNVSEYS
jgi:hypothetical protein